MNLILPLSSFASDVPFKNMDFLMEVLSLVPTVAFCLFDFFPNYVS